MSLMTAVFSKAWEITRRQRRWWLFGFLVALLGSPMLLNAFQSPPLSGDYLRTTPPQAFTTAGWQPPAFWRDLIASMPASKVTAVSTALLLATLALMLVFYGLAVAGKAVLLRGAAYFSRGETPSTGHLWAESRRFFWPLFFFPLPAGVLFIITVMVAGAFIGLVAWKAGAAALLLLVPFFVFSFLLVWLLHIYFYLGSGAIVLEEKSFWQAFSRGWEMWKTHFWQVLLVGLVLSVGQWIIAMALFYLASMLMLLLSLLLQMGEATLIPWFIAHPMMLAVASFALLLSGKIALALVLAPVMTFVVVSWGLLYLALLGVWSPEGNAAPPPQPLSPEDGTT